MINLQFKRGTEIFLIKISNKNLCFATITNCIPMWTQDVAGLQLSIAGILKEFPELKDLSNDEIKKEGIKRFKEKINSLPDEQTIMEYLVDDLKKYGYELKLWQRGGHRAKKIL